MFYGQNYLILEGRFAANPDLSKTQSGVSVCRFRVLVNFPSYKKGDEYVERPPFSINCVAWRGTAEYIAKHGGKGKTISGLFTLANNRNEREKDGVKTVYLDVTATPMSGSVLNIFRVSSEKDGETETKTEQSEYQTDNQTPTAPDFDETYSLENETGELPF